MGIIEFICSYLDWLYHSRYEKEGDNASFFSVQFLLFKGP